LCSDRIQLDPNDYRAFFDRALASEILQDWKAALADYQTTTQLAPDFYIAHIGVVRMHLVLGQLPEATRAAQETIELAESREANPAWAYLYLAHAYERSRDVANARLAHQKATSLAPGVDWIRFQAGQFYAGTGDPRDRLLAEQEYRAMIQVSSNRSWAHSSLADFYVKQDRLEEAVAEYRAAIQTNSEAGGLWVALANVFVQLEQKDQAREAYQRAVELEPDNFSAQFLYGNFLFYQGELESALRHWELARQINPHNCGLLLNIGQAYELLGDRERAEAFYRMAPGREVTPDQQC
jgi:tetratricopeptide (TPR) repeat protein